MNEWINVNMLGFNSSSFLLSHHTTGSSWGVFVPSEGHFCRAVFFFNKLNIHRDWTSMWLKLVFSTYADFWENTCHPAEQKNMISVHCWTHQTSCFFFNPFTLFSVQICSNLQPQWKYSGQAVNALTQKAASMVWLYNSLYCWILLQALWGQMNINLCLSLWLT